MANILDFGGVRVLTSNAQPGAGYVAKFYESGTTTPVTVYTTSALDTAHGTSVTADAAGRFAAVWSPGGAVKCVIEDADEAVIETIDPVISVLGGGSTAEDARNLILNGTGRIERDGYISGTATTIANQYTLAQWRVVVLGENLTFTGTQAGRVMTAPAGGAEQVISAGDIVGGTYVINWVGTATCTVNGTPRAKNETFTLTANTNVTIRFTSGTFTEVQVERGTYASLYEWSPRAVEENRCKAFYQQIRVMSKWTAAGAAEIDSREIMYPVQMRGVPTTWVVTETTSTNVTPNLTLRLLSLRLETVAIAGGVVEYDVLYGLTAEL